MKFGLFILCLLFLSGCSNISASHNSEEYKYKEFKIFRYSVIDYVIRFHDDEKDITCYFKADAGIFCLPDKDLK